MTTMICDPTPLVGAARTGDQHAWSQLVARYAGLVTTIARRQGLTPAESADVAQTTWLQLFLHIDTLSSPRGLASWLATTARRESYAVRRRRARELPVDEMDRHDRPAEVDEHDALLDRLEQSHRSEALHRAMDHLSDRERALLELLLVEEPLSYQEISARLDMPIGSIGPVRQRALTRLRGALAV